MSMVSSIFKYSNIDLILYIGAHIPIMSSVVEFFDILFLGIFIILSPAFDNRFYSKPPLTLVKEAAYSVSHFHSLLHIFSKRFIILLDGEPIAHSYIFHRMLAEFAAASVVFSKAIHFARDGEDDNGINYFRFVRQIEGILEGSYPSIFPYYSRCFDRGHKHFTWTGGVVEVLDRTEALDTLVSNTSKGELLDHPSHQVYITPVTGKRHERGESLDNSEQPSKRRR
jgi:hypothetical protein